MNAPSTDAELWRRIFAPRSLALIGVPRGDGIGRRFLEAAQSPGFAGAVYPVNPSASEILGVQTYPSVTAIGQPIDHAIVLTPAHAAAGVVAQCGEAGVRVAAMFVAGFDELASAEGDARARDLLEAARAGGVRLIGPNCMGVYSPAVALGPFPGMSTEVGDTAFISQSGSLMSMFAREASERGYATSKAVSAGNQLDLQAADFLRYLAGDDETKVVAIYVEGARDGRGFFEALRETAARKPVVLWKAGRTTGGARAVQSHTGALAGSRELWEAVARQSGAIPATNASDLIDLVVALHMRPLPAAAGIAVVTGPGGPAISAVDALEEAGLRLAQLDSGTIERLRGEINPVGTSPRNPVDVGLGGSAEAFDGGTRIAAADHAVDAVVVIGGGGPGQSMRRFAESMIAARDESGKPIALVTMQPLDDRELLRTYADAGIGVFPTPERAVRAMAGVVRYVRYRADIGLPVQ